MQSQSSQPQSAIITGGGTGIGRAIAVALAELGFRVTITGRREEVLKEACTQWNGEPPIQYHAADVTDREQVDSLVKSTLEATGRIDVLVNSAGGNIRNRAMANMRPNDWDRILEMNCTSAYNCIYAALPTMREQGSGLIVNISSIAGKRAIELGGIAYCASKFGMSALGTAVGNEVARDGIRVTNVYPGEVNTPILDDRPVPVDAAHKARILQPEDVGAMVAAIAMLPPRAHVPEIVIKPIGQEYC